MNGTELESEDGVRVEEACAILGGYLGSGDDPVFYRGVEMTVRDIVTKIDRFGDTGRNDAHHLTIEFFAGEKSHKRISGTIAEMVGERMGLLVRKGNALVKREALKGSRP